MKTKPLLWQSLRKRVVAFLPRCALACVVVVNLLSCSTGVEESPQPGFVRVTLQADPADTSIIIVTDTVRVSDSDSIDLTIFQGKVFSGAKFALLFRTPTSYRQEDARYNLLAQESGSYKIFVIYESRVPPGSYTKFQVGVTATVIKFRGLAPIPLQLRPGDPLLLDFPVNFEVFENRTTEIYVELSPLQSLSRFRDTYYLDRRMRVTSVRYY